MIAKWESATNWKNFFAQQQEDERRDDDVGNGIAISYNNNSRVFLSLKNFILIKEVVNKIKIITIRL